MFGRIAIVLLVVGALYVGARLVKESFTPETTTTPSRSAAGAPKKNAKQIEECSDACEQRAIVANGAADNTLQKCRAACRDDGNGGGPRETPSRITVSPHRPAAPPPIVPHDHQVK